jgi:TetR/AcrR family transcriptional repressor of mexJK operon
LDLGEYARRLLAATMDRRILQLRRLVIAEASRFPAMGGAYYERTYERSTNQLAATLAHLTERGLLPGRRPRARRAAAHLARLHTPEQGDAVRG